MIITVGSTSEMKLQAVRDLVPLYPCLEGAKVFGMKAPVMSNQPMTLDETVGGAMIRATTAYGQHSELDAKRFGFGIESGLMPLSKSNRRMMDVCVCMIFDGRVHRLGISSGFEVPPEVLELIKKGFELRDAFVEAQKLRKKDTAIATGVVEFLTNGRVDRTEFTKQAVMMALVQLEHPDWYGGGNA